MVDKTKLVLIESLVREGRSEDYILWALDPNYKTIRPSVLTKIVENIKSVLK